MINMMNEPVEIISLGFASRPRQKRLQAYPRRMVWGEHEYDLVDSGLHFLIKKGQELVRLFDVSDGHHCFRLRCDSHNNWTLVSRRTIA